MKNEEKSKGKVLLFGTFVGRIVGSIVALFSNPKYVEKLGEDVKLKTKKIIVNAEKEEDSLLDQSGSIPNKTKDKSELYIETGTPEIHNKDKH